MSVKKENKTVSFDLLGPRQLAAIYKLAGQMASMNDEQSILETILESLMDETGAEIGAFIHYDKNTDSFRPDKIKSIVDQDTREVQFSQTVFKQVYQTKQAVLSFDTRTDEQYRGRRSVIINQIHAILAFPLIVNDEVYGILYFDSRKNRQGFNEAARQFLSFFAVIASLALEQVLQKSRLQNENVRLKNQLEQDIQLPEMIGQTPVMKNLFRIVSRVARSDASVIITGENGTGKDLVARAIHQLSERKDKPYIAQYVGNIPQSILESELFGYKKGAFTGATSDRLGLFEAANGGTLFLDEIGDLTPDLQAKLLRVLQNREIKRLGENMIRHVDVRILAATNKDLVSMVKDGSFREDLYYRLNVINITVPTLRQRLEDIPLLVDHFLKRDENNTDMKISKEAIRKLMNYNWPGNVRQLENIIKRASILAANNVIDESDIEFDETRTQILDEHFNGTMEEIKNMVIEQRIKMFDGNKTRAAKSLQISLRSLQSKAKELGL